VKLWKLFIFFFFGALTASNELAKQYGPYQTFTGSPFSKGQLQFDLWQVTPSTRWDWAALRDNIRQYGTRNSLLTALMPTATTSQILEMLNVLNLLIPIFFVDVYLLENLLL